MLRDAAVAEIKQGLGFRTDLADVIIAAMQKAQRLLERGRTLPYFLLEEDAPLLLGMGVPAVELPERFLREHPDERIHFVDAEGEIRFLEKMDYGRVKPTFQDTDDGEPLAYIIRKTTLEFFPMPDADYTLEWSYYKGAEVLASNMENAWLEEEFGAPEVLIGRAGMIVAADLTNATAFAKFQTLYQEGWAGLLGDTFQRDEENKPLYMNERL